MKKDHVLQPSITVVLCTCNGESYLPEQLESIAGQKLLPAELLICDDASDDATDRIVSEFARKAPFPVTFYQNEIRLGVVENYSRLLQRCRAPYIALCDQDDIWLPHRLDSAFCALQKAGRQQGPLPLLVHSDLRVVDHHARPLAPSFMALRRIRHHRHEPLRRLLVQNFVTANTVLVNRTLLQAALPFPPGAVMHDWWLALVAAALGKIVFQAHPTVLYRQHETNLVGAGAFYSLQNFSRLLDRSGAEKELASVVKQARALQERLQKLNAPEPPFLGTFLEVLSAGGLRAPAAVLKLGIKKEGFFRNLYYLYLLARGDYLEYAGS